jgi:hypothetical protein
MQPKRLVTDTRAIGIHGITGRPYEEGTLAAGTLVRHVHEVNTPDGPMTRFEASTDAGDSWYVQWAYGRLQIEECSDA